MKYLALYTLLIMKGRDTTSIYDAGIICWSYSGLVQGSFFLCKDTVGKGITTVLCRSNPATVLLIPAGKFLLCVIVLNRVIACVVHKMDTVRNGSKGNLMGIAVSTGMFIQKIRYTNPD